MKLHEQDAGTTATTVGAATGTAAGVAGGVTGTAAGVAGGVTGTAAGVAGSAAGAIAGLLADPIIQATLLYVLATEGKEALTNKIKELLNEKSNESLDSGIIRINRLVEHHEDAAQWPDELLNMPVKELLDRVEASDTEEDSRYEAVEELILSLRDRILTPGEYDSPDSLDYEGLGGEESDEFGGGEDEDDEELPSFQDVTSQMTGNDGVDNWQF